MSTAPPAGLTLTRFQRHVLCVLHAIGPCSVDQVAEHCRQPRRAVRKAITRLRSVDLAERLEPGRFDITFIGRLIRREHRRQHDERLREILQRVRAPIAPTGGENYLAARLADPID